MIFQNDFERTIFCDEIHGVFGRILILTTRFDSSCKTLARRPIIMEKILTNYILSKNDNQEFSDKYVDKQIEACFANFKNLNRAIESLSIYKFEDAKKILDKARIARNELIHSSTLGFDKNIDKSEWINRYMQGIAKEVRDLIRGDILISAAITATNREEISSYFLGKKYEKLIMKWVFQRSI